MNAGEIIGIISGVIAALSGVGAMLNAYSVQRVPGVAEYTVPG